MKVVNHKVIMSQLQSRISKRAKDLHQLEEWKVVHRTLNQMQDWNDTKAAIKAKAEEQILDRKALATINQAERVTVAYSKLYAAYDEACAMINDLADGIGGA
jgi:ATP-dependent Lon protease